MPRHTQAKALSQTRDLRRNMKRSLTSHVSTRFYRSPEIILLEKDYGKACDVWSAGAIFGELLQTLPENVPVARDRTCQFPGTYCFPLSPNKYALLDADGIPEPHNDQLQHIIQLIGAPDAH